jgi:hypothetical protein
MDPTAGTKITIEPDGELLGVKATTDQKYDCIFIPMHQEKRWSLV